MKICHQLLFYTALCPVLAHAQTAPQPSTFQTLGGPKFENWTGLSGVKTKNSIPEARLAFPGTATFRYTQTEEKQSDSLTQRENRTWSRASGVRFEIHLADERPVTFDVSLLNSWDVKASPSATVQTTVQGAGWHTVLLLWKNFDLKQPSGILGDISGLRIAARGADGQSGNLTLRRPTIVRGENVWLGAEVRGKSVPAGETAQYQVTVGNPTDKMQAVNLAFDASSSNAMAPQVSPAMLSLKSGETKTVTVSVQVPSRVPAGGNETQILRVIGNGRGSASDKIEFVTAARLDYPNILHTKTGWDEVRAKVKNYSWAKEAQNGYVETANKWVVPRVQNSDNPKSGDWLFRTQEENNFMAAGIAYQLTDEAKYAEKVKTFLLRLSDPKNGFPITRRACNQASVQEGHFFQHIAMSYDMTIPSGLYSPAERAQIDATLRLYIGPEGSYGSGASNWAVSAQCGALYCALVLQDLVMAKEILYGSGKLVDQLREGTLDDGWWYELSISYNTWVATEFSQAGIALRPWGIDLINAQFPSSLRPNEQRIPEKSEYGITDAKWGPIYQLSISIKRMWDVLPTMSDYRGVMFGLNDSTERIVGGGAMEIAYYLYRDPAYVTVIRRGGEKRDLLYGVPELPENTPDLSARSAFADNAGVAVLRSQAVNRPQREQIQAVLTYGDHGWYHGHFDNVALNHLSRYGRSFFNPEFIWYGYPNYMYKFYVQTSVNKNMVVVDQKQQEPTPNQRVLFNSGPMMQAAVVQTKARWSNSPYGGMKYWDQPFKTFEEKSFAEGRSVPTPANLPTYGVMNTPTTSLSGYTEPILQRRALVVTDDYVVVADYLKGEKEHTFDSVMQLGGFQGLEGANKSLLRHDSQWNSDPLSSAQFVTDADWWKVSAPSRAAFGFKFGASREAVPANTEGSLNIDVHTLWPPQQELMLAQPPEVMPVARQVSYAVRGDGKTLVEGKSGMWILGEKAMDVPLEGVKSLELETQTGVTRPATLFWANARLVTADGKEIPLSSLPIIATNTIQPKEKGRDFEGGPIKIAGIPYSEATSAQPQDGSKPALVRLDLSGLNAVCFKCVLGGDYPLGDESGRRKTFAVRSTGKEARFLSVLEPFEDKRMVKSAVATDPDTLRVELNDGRIQEIHLTNLDGDEKSLAVSISESKNGVETRRESTF